MKSDDILSNLPDHVLIRDANQLTKENDPLGVVHLIGAELDRRRPDIKAEVIGYDNEGREIWLEL